MTKRKTIKNIVQDKKDYYNLIKYEFDERSFELLMIKIFSSKALSLKDAEELLRLYLRHLSKNFNGYDEVKSKDIQLTQVIKETYC